MTTIAQERAALVKVGRPLISREKWGSRFTRYDELDGRRTVEPAPLVFIHITITNPKNYASDEAHARAVEAIGISRFPNTGISYNRLHFQSGKAMEGQPMGRRGAHTVNDKNKTRCDTAGCPSLGTGIPSAATNLNNVVRAYVICINVGDTVTPEMLTSLAMSIAADMLAGLVRRDAHIHGHRCVAWKDCPAAKMWAQMGALAGLVAHYLKVGVRPAQDNDLEEDVALTTEDKAWIESRVQAYALYITENRRQTMDDQAAVVWAHPIDNTSAGGMLIQIRDDVDDGPTALQRAAIQVTQTKVEVPAVPDEIAHLVSPLGEENPVQPDGSRLP